MLYYVHQLLLFLPTAMQNCIKKTTTTLQNLCSTLFLRLCKVWKNTMKLSHLFLLSVMHIQSWESSRDIRTVAHTAKRFLVRLKTQVNYTHLVLPLCSEPLCSLAAFKCRPIRLWLDSQKARVVASTTHTTSTARFRGGGMCANEMNTGTWCC